MMRRPAKILPCAILAYGACACGGGRSDWVSRLLNLLSLSSSLSGVWYERARACRLHYNIMRARLQDDTHGAREDVAIIYTLSSFSDCEKFLVTKVIKKWTNTGRGVTK